MNILIINKKNYLLRNKLRKDLQIMPNVKEIIYINCIVFFIFFYHFSKSNIDIINFICYTILKHYYLLHIILKKYCIQLKIIPYGISYLIGLLRDFILTNIMKPLYYLIVCIFYLNTLLRDYHETIVFRAYSRDL